MTDLEITQLCGLAMYGGINPVRLGNSVTGELVRYECLGKLYDPLHDDAQAMALVKKFHLHIGKTLRTPDEPFGQWFVSKTDKFEAPNHDLNRSICECVAKMQEAKALGK